MIIAIDGPAGSGKGAIAKMIDEKLGFTRIDTGAMYRCVALKMLRNDIKMEDIENIQRMLNDTKIELIKKNGELIIYLDDEDVSRLIRTPEVNAVVSPVSSVKEIRIKMVDLQRAMKNVANDIVMEGRDITTVVFPDADLKVYLTADLNERAKRRYLDLKESNADISYEEVYENIKFRDENDKNKEMGALKIAEDAVIIDNTNLNIEETFEVFKELIEKHKTA